jgi:hypothetical protein
VGGDELEDPREGGLGGVAALAEVVLIEGVEVVEDPREAGDELVGGAAWLEFVGEVALSVEEVGGGPGGAEVLVFAVEEGEVGAEDLVEAEGVVVDAEGGQVEVAVGGVGDAVDADLRACSMGQVGDRLDVVDRADDVGAVGEGDEADAIVEEGAEIA